MQLACSFSVISAISVSTSLAFFGCSAPIESGRSPDRTSQEIIAIALNAFVASRAEPLGNRRYLVPERTTIFSRYDDVDEFASRWEKEGWPDEDVNSAIREFVRAPTKSVPISDRPSFSFSFRRISAEEEARLLDDPESIGWDQTFSDSSPTAGLLQISAPFIDSTGRFAIAYVVWIGGRNVAEGSLLVLTKKEDNWVVDEEIGSWSA